MKLQQLQAFVAAAHHGSLRGAARDLDLTQPAVTRTIRELEGALKVELVTRGVRGIELTACGRALLPRAEQLLADMQRTIESVKQVSGELTGKVSIGTMPSVALTFLPKAVTAFRRAMPLVKLHMQEVTVLDAVAQLRSGKIDIAAIRHIPELESDLAQAPLYSTQFVVAMRAGHPLENATRLEQLLDAEWIATGGSDHFSQSVLTTMFTAHGLPVPRRLLHAPSSFAVALGLVSQTDMIGCFTKALATMVTPLGIHVANIEETLPGYDLSIISRRDLLPTPAVAQFVSCLEDAARR
jgi:LysR family transcriptional regulator of abg operon